MTIDFLKSVSKVYYLLLEVFTKFWRALKSVQKSKILIVLALVLLIVFVTL